jgi:hypothetical protein
MLFCRDVSQVRSGLVPHLLLWAFFAPLWLLHLSSPLGTAQTQPADQHEEHTSPPNQETTERSGSQHSDLKQMGDHHNAMPSVSGMEDGQMDHEGMNSTGMFLMGQSSGTGYQPSAWPMPMLMTRVGDWHLMWMGQAYVTATQQSGPRGGDKFYSTNWGMLSAIRRLGRGSVMLRTMVSLDPLTVTKRRYPLLFQTGETAFGRPIVDGQHPHDLVMELSAQYAYPLGERGVFNAYYAPVGDVALGPVAYPHRASAMELPQAVLAHHWQDSTHIANNVLTTGVSYGPVRIEGSGFLGREPLENRWNLDWRGMDSWSGRLSVFPARGWMAQASTGRLERPEQLHPDDVVRSTASVHYVLAVRGGNSWATSLIWARNYRTVGKYATHAIVGETVVPFSRKNFVTGRFEWSQRDELFDNDLELRERIERETGGHIFPVSAYTVGYTRDFEFVRNAQTGIGANVTAYAPDSALKPFYGDRPWGINIFVRARLRRSE